MHPVRAFRKQQDTHVPIEVKHVSPLLASVTDEDVRDLGGLPADLLKEKGDENMRMTTWQPKQLRKLSRKCSKQRSITNLVESTLQVCFAHYLVH